MNLKKYIWAIMLMGIICSACNDAWDEHYQTEKNEFSTVDVEVVSTSTVEYMKTNSDYSELFQMFEKYGLLEQMNTEGLHYTVLAVKNDAWASSEGSTEEQQLFLANTYVANIAISPANLVDGQTIQVWNGKLVNITATDEVVRSGGSDIGFAFNGVKATKVVKTTSGYIYELENMIYTPQTMYEFISGLGDEYSIFRDLVLNKEVREFDEKNSELIGVDAMGNNVYDSVFVSRLPLFEDRKFNMKNEALKATVLIPTNQQIEDAIENAKQRLDDYGWILEDTVLTEWCYQSLFFNQKYEPSAFQETNPDKIDLTSLFGKQWRTTVNKVDITNPVELSNGLAYYVNSFKIPSNILLWRLKGYMYHYYYLSEAEREEFYNIENFSLYGEPTVRYGPWSPGPEWPLISNITQIMYLTDNQQPGRVNFKCYDYIDYGDGTHRLIAHKLPPGEYDFCMGFGNTKNRGVDMSIYLNDKFIITLTPQQQSGSNWDRYGDNPPIGSPDKRYDTDGWKWATITIDGDGPVELKFRLECSKMVTGQDIQLHHYTFRPSKNFY